MKFKQKLYVRLHVYAYYCRVSSMLDKETVTAQSCVQKVENKEELFLNCVNKAKKYVEDDEIEECFERVSQLNSVLKD